MKDIVQTIVDEKAEEYDVDPDSLVFPEWKLEAIFESKGEQELRDRLDQLMEMVSDDES